MALFKKKQTLRPQRGPEAGVPTDLVIQMRQQGMSNNQITQNLQREGYVTSQVMDALNQADIKGIVEAQPMEPQMQQEPMLTQEAQMPPPPMPESMNAPMNTSMNTLMPAYEQGEQIEEVVEGIVDEKWDELMKSVDKIVQWKEGTETKINKIEQQIENLTKNFDELHRGILTKVGEYDKGIRNVGTEIKAMEEVFKKVLPTFTENVGELTRITKRLKIKNNSKQ